MGFWLLFGSSYYLIMAGSGFNSAVGAGVILTLIFSSLARIKIVFVPTIVSLVTRGDESFVDLMIILY